MPILFLGGGLLDAFPDRVADEGDDLDAVFLQNLGDGLVLVIDEGLNVEAGGGEDLVDFPDDDLGLDVVRFVDELGILGDFGLGDLGFPFPYLGWDIGEGKVGGVVGDDGHGQGLVEVAAILRKEDEAGDLPLHVGIGAIGLPVLGVEDDVAAQDELLAHGDGRLGEGVFGELNGFLKGLGVVFKKDVGDLVDEGVELIRAGDEVGLAVDLDDDGLPAFMANLDVGKALGGDAAGFGGGFGDAFLAEDVDGFLNVPVDFLEGALAIHDAGAGPIAKGFDLIDGDGHCYLASPSVFLASASALALAASALRAA